jgi:hypothetical protein
MKKTPMPSPRGTNMAMKFLPPGFSLGGAAYDQAPSPALSPAAFRRRARRFFEDHWRTQWQEFCAATGLADEGEDKSVSEPQHRAIGAAESQHSGELEYGTEDDLPEYGPNGLPRNNIAARRPGAMDELTRHITVERDPPRRQAPRPSEQVRQRLLAMAPGLANIKIGV